MRDHIRCNASICGVCQKQKKKHKKYGLLPEKKAEFQPWEQLCVNLIGPYKIKSNKRGHKIPELKCITMIDPATGWFEIKQYDDKRSITVANIVEQEWLARYPRPSLITLDRGSEFIGEDFRDMCENDYGIKAKKGHFHAKSTGECHSRVCASDTRESNQEFCTSKQTLL